jgi:hypothetical protein
MMHPDDTSAFAGGTPGWLFRGDESAWDVLMSALATDPSQPAPWPIAPSGPSMAAGDRVLLWRSGKDGGIAAVCTVLDEPIATVGADGRPRVTVDIRVDRAFGHPIAPVELLQHDALRPLAFMDLFETTEHRIAPLQAQALAELIPGRDHGSAPSDRTDRSGSATTMTAIEVPAGLVGIVSELMAALGAADEPRTSHGSSHPEQPIDVGRAQTEPAGPAEPTDHQVTQAEEALRMHGSQPFTIDEVAATWRTGVGTARSRIERLLESGLVERAGTRALSQPGSARPARGRPPVLYRLRTTDLLER